LLNKQGDNARVLHIVLAGHVLVQRRNQMAASVLDDKETLAELGVGKIVGSLSAFSSDAVVTTAIAGDHAETIELELAPLRDVFSESPDLFMAIIRILARRISDTDELVEQTLAAALQVFEPVIETKKKDGIDPERAVEIRRRWRELKQADAD